MSTVSLSLTDHQVSEIDRLSGVFGFENRSEFARAIFRTVLSDEDLLKKSVAFPLNVPVEKSTKKIMAGFKKTNKYSPEFFSQLGSSVQEPPFISQNSRCF